MPISLDSLNSGSAAPAASNAGLGIPLSALSEDIPSTGKANSPTPVQKLAGAASKLGRATMDDLNKSGNRFWQIYTDQSNSAVQAARADIEDIPKVPTGEWVRGLKDIGGALINTVGAIASPLTSTAQWLVGDPIDRAVHAGGKLAVATGQNQADVDRQEQVITEWTDNLVQLTAGAIGGDADGVHPITPEGEIPSMVKKEPPLGDLKLNPNKPRVRVVGVRPDGKPIIRIVDNPHPVVKTADEASHAAAVSFQSLAIEHPEAASTVAEEVGKTQPNLGEALSQQVNELAKATPEQEEKVGVEEARVASHDTEAGLHNYWAQAQRNIQDDLDAHAANGEKGVPVSSHKLLDKLIYTTSNAPKDTTLSYMNQLLIKLKMSTDNIPVHFKSMLQNDKGEDDGSIGGLFIYNRQSTPGVKGVKISPMRIEVRPTPYGTVKTLVHELVHHATVKFLEERPDHPAAKELDRLWSIALERHAAKPDQLPSWKSIDVGGSPYGLTNPHEFVAEALSNPDFQDWLISSESWRKPGERLSNMWSKFVGALHRMFGIKNPTEAQLLHNVVRLSTNIIDNQAIMNSVRKVADRASQAAADAYRLADRQTPRAPDPHGFKGLSRAADAVGMGLVKGKIKEYWNFILDNFAPEAKGIEARKAGAILAEAIGKRVQSDTVHFEKGRVRRDFWTKNPELAQKFIRGFEKGETFDHPVLKSAAEGYKAWAKALEAQDKASGIEYEPVDHYLPHIFERSDDLAEWLSQQFGQSWTKPGFAKDRGFDLYEQAIKAGFKPKYTNPEDIMLARQQASNMAQMKVDTLKELTAQGLAVDAEKGDKIPPWLAKKYPSPNGKSVWVNSRAAPVIQNALNSRSLWNMRGPVGDGFKLMMWMKNKMVPIRLAMSLYHPLHIATIHNAAGMVRASKEMLSGAMNPVEWAGHMVKESSLIWSLIEDSKQGNRLMKAYKGQIKAGDLMEHEQLGLQYLVEGGLTPELSMVYRGRAIEKFHDAILQRKASAVWHAPYAAIESMQSVMFQKWIPALKVASFLKDARSAMKVNGHLANDPMARRMVMRDLAKSVDNRYGEMAYNTLFWNRWVKDLAVANTLSLGWQLGFIREFGGGALDLGKAMVTKGGVKGKASSGLLDRPMFSMFYMTQALGYGGLLTYAMTGKTPSGLMDYIYPRTGETDDQGNPMRVSTMFYTKEIASLYKHIENEGVLSAVGDIAMSKAAGQIGLIEEWARGVNDYGQEIRDPNAPAYKQLEQTLYRTLIDLEPISLGNQGSKSGEDTGLSILGFNTAPKYATETKGEAAITSVYDKYYAAKETPFASAERSTDAKKLRALYASNDTDKFDDQLQTMQDKYNLSGAEVKRLVRGIARGEDSHVHMFQEMTFDQQKRILDKMTPEEREKYLPYSSKSHRAELEDQYER